MRAVGVDVGATRFHLLAVSVAPSGRLRFVDRLVTPGCSVAAVDFCAGAARVAIDAPGEPSRGAHRTDPSVAPKFRSGRCSEVPVPGVPAVPWITPPAGQPVPGWMAAGFGLWSALREAGHQPVETFPAACYHRLNGGRWPPKKTLLSGRRRRVDLLESAGLALPALEWTHDYLDAAAAALVAARGHPTFHGCPSPDGSVMWVL